VRVVQINSWRKIRDNQINNINNYINTECNRIRYTNLKIYCDQTNNNITTQFLTEHLLTLQIFFRVYNMAAISYATDIHTIF
jgi:hypothetical protein